MKKKSIIPNSERIYTGAFCCALDFFSSGVSFKGCPKNFKWITSRFFSFLSSDHVELFLLTCLSFLFSWFYKKWNVDSVWCDGVSRFYKIIFIIVVVYLGLPWVYSSLLCLVRNLDILVYFQGLVVLILS